MLDYPRWKTTLVLAICLLGTVLALPNLFSAATLARFPSFLPSARVNLGLDLQGGAHLLFRVDAESLIKARLDLLEDEVREKLRATRDADGRRIAISSLRAVGNAVVLSLRDPAHVPVMEKALRDLSAPVAGLANDGLGQRDLALHSEGADIRLELTEAGISERKRQAVAQSIEVLRRRIDPDGVTEPIIQRQGEDRIVVQVPGVQDSNEVKQRAGQTAKLDFRLVNVGVSAEDIARGRAPAGTEILAMADNPAEKIAIEKRVMVSGGQLKDAQPGFDPQSSVPVVNIRFDTAGAKRFAETTRKNVGRPFAIVLDKEVISAPRINEPIMGGAAQISGAFTVEEASRLAVLLRSGALPAKLDVLEERTIGPGLGADSIAAGGIAALIGMAFVVVFMVGAYGLFGVFANAALAINVALIFGALTAFGATLTLPGIAGIVLTIGMAVDANVLIFERIRDEVRAGRSPAAALDSGFNNALSTIWDANITTLIATALMFQFGSGPIKGFAITLTIGVMTSVFSAIMVTRLLLISWYRRRRPAKLPI